MAACFRCEHWKPDCSDRPTCIQCSLDCNYTQLDQSCLGTQNKKRLSSTAYSDDSSKKRQRANVATEASDLRHPNYSFLQSAQAFKSVSVSPSIENPPQPGISNAPSSSTRELQCTGTTNLRNLYLIPPLTSGVSQTSDLFDLRLSPPPVEGRKFNFLPSPSPPPVVPLPQPSRESSTAPSDSGSQNQKSNKFWNWATSLYIWLYRSSISQPPPLIKPTAADGTLVSFLDGGRNPDIAHRATIEVLASENEEDLAIKQALVTATRPFRKLISKIGRIRWMRGMKIEDFKIEKGFESLERLEKATDKDMEAWIEEGFQEEIKDRKGLRKELRKERKELKMREGLKRGLREERALRKEWRRKGEEWRKKKEEWKKKKEEWKKKREEWRKRSENGKEGT